MTTLRCTNGWISAQELRCWHFKIIQRECLKSCGLRKNMRAEKNRPANSSDDWTLVVTCAWHYHKSQTADNTWAENYWKITRHYTTNACCYNRKTGLDLIVSHLEITVHIGHYTHKWNLNIKIKHGIWHSIIANNLCDKLSQKGDKNPYKRIQSCMHCIAIAIAMSWVWWEKSLEKTQNSGLVYETGSVPKS